MIVLQTNFNQAVEEISTCLVRSLDTETTGLRPFHGDRIFAMIVGTPKDTYYFNFNAYPDWEPADDRLLASGSWQVLQRHLFRDKRVKWYLHNAKFDMHMLANEECFLEGEIFCTLAQGRVEHNEHPKYDLDSSLVRIGGKKTFDVKRYCSQHELFETVQIPGKKKKEIRYFYHKVPYEIITGYGIGDGRGTYDLGIVLEASIKKQSEETPAGLPRVLAVSANESRLTHTLFRLEQVGVRIDKEYCLRAARWEEDRATKSLESFRKETGVEYKASSKCLSPVFICERDKWEWTELGTPSFDSEVLAKFEHPAAKMILEYRDAKSKSDYYNGFLYHADSFGDVHPTYNPHGARHGRFSSSNPNLQNITSEEGEEEKEFIVRRAIIPRPGFVFIMPDYDQMEYRLMLEVAAELQGGETELIRLVKGGLDVHEATARIATEAGASIGRFEAKHSNFCALYGGGDQMLCDTINKLSKGQAKCTVGKANTIKRTLFKAAPEIDNLIKTAMKVAEERGFIRNWLGRRCWFPNTRLSYRAPNYLIAGGCADILKVAMNRIDEYLLDKKSRMVLNVHDELPCEIHESEVDEVPKKIKEIMEGVYPWKFLPLTCGMEHSYKSLGDKIKGFPGETRNKIQAV